MKPQPAFEQNSVGPQRWEQKLDLLSKLARQWATSDGMIWLHMLKTVTAALMAMGIAMRLEMSQPKIAMTTVFVLMQPLSGMVFAKSFYRVVGTAVGVVAALVLASLFAQQPDLYMAGITLWIGGCVALAVRYRNFRWYGFVLAGYTAALVGLPVVLTPLTLFQFALTRAGEVAVGIFCAAAVSGLILPLSSAKALVRSLKVRQEKFLAFASASLAGNIGREEFEREFAALVDATVSFESNRAFASFEDPHIRARSRRLARLNSEFMDACTRLYAIHQLFKRLRANHADAVLAATAPHVDALAQRLADLRNDDPTRVPQRIKDALVELRAFHDTLPKAARESRRALEEHAPEGLLDYDTAMELMYRFAGELLAYADTYASLDNDTHEFERSVTQYEVKTNPYFIAFTFLRTVVAVGAMSAFWLASEWPNGALAVIGTAMTCALSSTTPRASKFVAQMAMGAMCATVAGYVLMCYVYPHIDGFPLLCAVLVPVLGIGPFLAMRPGKAGFGLGYAVFFCLLAGPDNVIAYLPDLEINNGIALVIAMLGCSVVFAVVFPMQMPWLTNRIGRDLRQQVNLACTGELPGLGQRFQSSTRDLMVQLRGLLSERTDQQRDVLSWTLATLEVGQAVIDLRDDLPAMPAGKPPRDEHWIEEIHLVLRTMPRFFDDPTPNHHARALKSVNLALDAVRHALDEWHAIPEERHRIQRIASSLHFMRSVLLDKDTPFNRGRDA